MNLKPYLFNCFLLLIPIFGWNILLVDYLPDLFSSGVFDKDIPSYIIVSENVLRVIVFLLPLFMVLSVKTKSQKIGLIIYIVGVLLYFASWLMLTGYPQSNWSTSVLGSTAPAFTTIIWFIGIGLIGNTSFLRIPKISTLYISLSLIFVVIHTTHAYLAFQNFYLN